MSTPFPDPFIQHLLEANRCFVDQIRVADQKAAYIFTFILALMVWSTETRHALNATNFLAADPATQATSLVLIASLLTALCTAICAILPRSRPGTSVFYWGAWPAAGERLREARANADTAFIEADLMQNTTTLSTICQAKYRLVRVAFRALLVVVCAYLALLLLPN